MVFTTAGDLVPGLKVTAEDDEEAARAKGSLQILDVLAAAVADRQRAPENPMPIQLADVSVRIDADIAQWAIEEARASKLPHNEARTVFTDVLTWALTERAIPRIGKGWLTREDRKAWEHLRAELLDELGITRIRRCPGRAVADAHTGDTVVGAVHLARAIAGGRCGSGAGPAHR